MKEGNTKKNRAKNEKIFSLVQKAKNGDTSAFDQIYEEYFVPLFRYIYFRTNNKEDAEDLTQIVFLKAWKAMPRFQKQANPFSSWLYRIAKNTVIDYYKKKKDLIFNDSEDFLKQVKDIKANPNQEIEQKEKTTIILQAINQLTEDQQDAITLKFITGLSNKKIAKLLDKNEDAIRALQYRGLKALRSSFKKSNLL